jgi:hypothetical protein
MFRCLALMLTLAALLLAQEPQRGQGQSGPGAVSAAISVQWPTLFEGHTEDLQIFFSVVNDGSSTIKPNVEGSHLLINGTEPGDWINVIGNGIRTPLFLSLPPGEALRFTYQLGRYFGKPGLYIVGWRGDGFKAPEIAIRVLPRKR